MNNLTKIKPLLPAIAAILIIGSCTTEPSRLFAGDPQYPDYDQITLLDGPFKVAMERTHSYLLELDPDRLLHHFRLNAGLDTIAPAYLGWEERELRGHTTGHYLSACAMMFLATGDSLLLERVNYIVNSLAECQTGNGNGYLSAFPEEFIDRAERMEEVWAPYYTLHKIMAGLYDSYQLLGNSQALEHG
ncbi:MAG: glycoside hydrolase family 127 protein [Bacteroidales bacterium]|nr:glycoside hydrolase family 127 protein [Bacteroidales bacterium]